MLLKSSASSPTISVFWGSTRQLTALSSAVHQAGWQAADAQDYARLVIGIGFDVDLLGKHQHTGAHWRQTLGRGYRLFFALGLLHGVGNQLLAVLFKGLHEIHRRHGALRSSRRA